MIKVNLLGGIKKFAGCSALSISKSESSLNDIIYYLEENYSLKNRIKDNEVMIAVNGVESSILGGRQAKISSGDIVTIISTVHGG